MHGREPGCVPGEAAAAAQRPPASARTSWSRAPPLPSRGRCTWRHPPAPRVASLSRTASPGSPRMHQLQRCSHHAILKQSLPILLGCKALYRNLLGALLVIESNGACGQMSYAGNLTCRVLGALLVIESNGACGQLSHAGNLTCRRAARVRSPPGRSRCPCTAPPARSPARSRPRRTRWPAGRCAGCWSPASAPRAAPVPPAAPGHLCKYVGPAKRPHLRRGVCWRVHPRHRGLIATDSLQLAPDLCRANSAAMC